MKDKFLVKWAGAFLLAAALLALAALLAFGSQGKQSDWGWGFTILGFASLAAWFFGRRGQPKTAGDKYARQRFVLGVNAVISVLLVLVLLVGVNYIAARRNKVFDLTKNRVNSLADQTTQAIRDLKVPVKLTYVWAPSEFAPVIDATAQSILEAYRETDSSKVKVEFLNAVQDPLKFQAMGITTFSGQPLLIVEKVEGKSEGNAAPSARQEIGMVDEQNITSALLKLNEPKPRTIYLLTGHGEQLLATSGRVPMTAARAALESQNYTIKTLSIIGAKAEIPKDAAAVIALGPQVDLSAQEEQKLKTYLAGKGRLALFFQMPRNPLPRWRSLAKSFNVEVGDGIVLELDPSKSGGNPQIVAGAVDDPLRHPVLRSVSGTVLFPGVLPLKVAEGQSAGAGATGSATALFETSINANSLSSSGGQLKQTASGPFAAAIAVEKPGGARIVVVGNASFASDGAFNQYGNGSFFLGAVNWVVGNDALVTIPPKQPVTNSITMTAGTRNFAALLSMAVLPLAVLLLGTVVWWKRR